MKKPKTTPRKYWKYLGQKPTSVGISIFAILLWKLGRKLDLKQDPLPQGWLAKWNLQKRLIMKLRKRYEKAQTV